MKKINYSNEKSDKMYSYYVQTEMLTLHLDFHSFEGVLMDWGYSIVTKLDMCSEMGSGSVVLFIENLNFIVGIFKENFVLRGGRKKNNLMNYNVDLKGWQGIQQVCFDTGIQ